MENNNTPKNEEPTTVTSNSETVAVTETTSVTSSSPTTSAASAFQPFQQLHEAVLAAVNSHNVGLPTSLFSAAVAAAAANNNNVTIHPQPFDQPLEQQRTVLTDAENAKKESIRASNRERKKKWRLHNEERNKDNDLRCRVNKRAQKLYGPNDSVAKQQWIEEEFEKRRQKRMEKERRKHIVNNVLSVPGANDATTSGGADNNNGISSIVNNQMSAYYSPLPQIDTATAAKLLDFPTDLQRQLLEQLNNSMLAFTNGIQQPAQTEENTNTENQSMDTNFTNESNTNENTESNDASVIDPATAAVTAQAANDALQQIIAQGLSATATSTSTTSSNHNSPLPFTEETNDEEGAKPESEETNAKEEEIKEEGATGEKKPEYPMDAVLTLMQLNAGWRQ